MKFDVIISNPPYNKDMYLDFVEAAYDLLTPDGMGIFITPAKFYAKGGEKNEHFREKIMPHIKEVHLYKCCTDIFDIAERGGIAYYDVYRSQTFNEKIITNHNKNASLDDSSLPETERTHTEKPVEFMTNSCLALINKVKRVAGRQALFTDGMPLTDSYYCSRGITAHSELRGTLGKDSFTLLTGAGNILSPVGYLYATDKELRNTDNLDKYRVVIGNMMSGKGLQPDKTGKFNGFTAPTIIKPTQVASYTTLFIADTESEATSFLSYFDSNLVKFIAINTVMANGSNSKENWRHVPALPAGYKFDHIYTNEEIFKIFELTDDEIKLITNLIKPRKEK